MSNKAEKIELIFKKWENYHYEPSNSLDDSFSEAEQPILQREFEKYKYENEKDDLDLQKQKTAQKLSSSQRCIMDNLPDKISYDKLTHKLDIYNKLHSINSKCKIYNQFDDNNNCNLANQQDILHIESMQNLPICDVNIGYDNKFYEELKNKSNRNSLSKSPRPVKGNYSTNFSTEATKNIEENKNINYIELGHSYDRSEIFEEEIIYSKLTYEDEQEKLEDYNNNNNKTNRTSCSTKDTQKFKNDCKNIDNYNNKDDIISIGDIQSFREENLHAANEPQKFKFTTKLQEAEIKANKEAHLVASSSFISDNKSNISRINNKRSILSKKSSDYISAKEKTNNFFFNSNNNSANLNHYESYDKYRKRVQFKRGFSLPEEASNTATCASIYNKAEEFLFVIIMIILLIIDPLIIFILKVLDCINIKCTKINNSNIINNKYASGNNYNNSNKFTHYLICDENDAEEMNNNINDIDNFESNMNISCYEKYSNFVFNNYAYRKHRKTIKIVFIAIALVMNLIILTSIQDKFLKYVLFFLNNLYLLFHTMDIYNELLLGQTENLKWNNLLNEINLL